MALGNFYEIMEGIIGAAQTDYERAIIYTISAFFGIFIILFVFQLFIMIGNLANVRRK